MNTEAWKTVVAVTTGVIGILVAAYVAQVAAGVQAATSDLKGAVQEIRQDVRDVKSEQQTIRDKLADAKNTSTAIEVHTTYLRKEFDQLIERLDGGGRKR